jgi:hypothetical protein
MSRLRERLYKEYNLEQLGYDFLGYTFKNKKELSTHHIIPRHSGGQTKKNNLCVLNRNTSHNYIHLIEDTDYKVFLQISRELLEQVKQGKIKMENLKNINELLQFFEYKYRNEEDRHGELLIKPRYKKRILTKEDLNE